MNVPGDASRARVTWDHNAARAYAARGSLAIDAPTTWRAQQAADRVRAESGSRGCRLNHTSSDQMWANYGRSWGENLGCYSGCANVAGKATKAFLASPMHRDNILSASFSAFGVGVACNGRFLFVAVHFVA